MIDHVDNMIRHLLLDRIDELTSELQVRFQPPDENWLSYVSTLTDSGGAPVNAVNVYLFDARENVKLRSNAVTRTPVDGFVHQSFTPRRLDCHYLVTAWSPATVTPPVEPTLDEHALLYKLASLFMNNSVLVASEVYGGALPPGFPAELERAEIPLTVAAPEGFPKNAEFWGTMGNNHRWRPALQLVVTLPVLDHAVKTSAVVTTRIVAYRVGGSPIGPDVRIQIGGWVRDATQPPLPDGSAPPVAGAFVAIETAAGIRLRATQTAANGSFTFGELSPGSFVLRAAAPLHSETSRTIDVPSPSGDYDLLFT
jgi:hypothetical protein